MPLRCPDYLADLGVGAVYLSPLLQAVAGSDHGYDVVDHRRIDPARGGDEGWARSRRPPESPGWGSFDIVPNHMGVAAPEENPAWWDLLRHGRESAYADWFDIDWSANAAGCCSRCSATTSILTPTWRSTRGELRYCEHRFPIAPGTGDGEPGRGPRPAALRAGQLPPRRHRAELPPVLRGHRPGRPAGRGPGGVRGDPRPDPAVAARRRRSTACASTTRTGWPTRGGTWIGSLLRPRVVDHRREDPRTRRAAARAGRSPAPPATTRSARWRRCSSTRPPRPP